MILKPDNQKEDKAINTSDKIIELFVERFSLLPASASLEEKNEAVLTFLSNLSETDIIFEKLKIIFEASPDRYFIFLLQPNGTVNIEISGEGAICIASYLNLSNKIDIVDSDKNGLIIKTTYISQNGEAISDIGHTERSNTGIGAVDNRTTKRLIKQINNNITEKIIKSIFGDLKITVSEAEQRGIKI